MMSDGEVKLTSDMPKLQRVLIVEDDSFISTDIDLALKAAGYEVCGVAANYHDAVGPSLAFDPTMAVVDVQLSPGNGREVARELADKFRTKVLIATAEPTSTLQGVGAIGVIPKLYDADIIPKGLKSAGAMANGEHQGLPDHMRRLSRLCSQLGVRR